MTLAEDLNAQNVVLYDGDSRSRQLIVDHPDDDGTPICTTGAPENHHWGIADLYEEEIAGYWVLSVVHTDGSRAWWHAGEEEWKDGVPQ